jgi:regulator of replication initiation timing
MSESEAFERIRRLEQIVAELEAQIDAIQQRLATAEQSLAARWGMAGQD